MEQKPLISVIVPVYGVEEYLDRCVQSIVDQTYHNLEIILVDDGSPDNCGAMCDAWAAKDSRIKVIHKENGGLSDARNAGMAIATGELMAFVDSDDHISPDMYRQLYERMQADNSDIAACGVEMVWEEGTPSRMLTKPGTFVLDTVEAMQAIIEESMLKQPVWYKLWSYQAIAEAKKVSITDQIGYYYIQRSGSIMGESFSMKRLDGLEAQLQRQAFLDARFPKLASQARTDLYFSCLYLGQMSQKYLNKEDKEIAFEKLHAAQRQHPLTGEDKKRLPLKQRVWSILPLYAACKVRNWLKIGV